MTTTEWRWVDIDGTEQVVGVDGLMRMLSSGSLPPYTLVWKTTWVGWHPASEVPELAAAAGSGTVGARPIPTSPSSVNPPPPPVDRYMELQGKATTLLAERSRRSTPPPLRRNLPRPASALSSTVRGPAAPPANLPGRSTMIGMVPHPSAPLVPPVAQPPVAHPLAARSTMIGMAPQASPATVPAPQGSAESPPPETTKGVVPVPPLARTLAGLTAQKPLAPQVPEGSIPTGPIRIRGVLPTLTEEEEATHSPTLRPVNALPPPPRTAPKVTGEGGAPSLASAAMEPAPAIQTPLPLPPPPTPILQAQSEAVHPNLASAVRSEGIPSSVPKQASPRRGLGGMSSKTFTLLTGLSFLIPGTAVLVLALLKPRTSGPVAPAQSAAASAPEAPERAAVGCSIERPAKRIAESAFFQVPIIAASAKNGTRVAIGFATDKIDAKGILVDPVDLSSVDAFTTRSRTAILGVVPMTASNDVAFVVDEAQPAFASARTVDAKQRFSVGVTLNGFATRSGSGEEVVWPGKSDKPTITTPRVAAAPDGGYAVAFRHGGQDGKILVGWLDDTGHKKSDLKAVSTDATLVGTPVVAAGPKGALLAFAAKNAAADPYGIELARAPIGGVPEHSRRFPIPAGGPGTEAISPSVENIGQGRYLLQWTEGSAGNRAVRVQILSADLVPMGEPATLSAADQNAGQGALWVGMDRALALFLSKTEASHELWGATLKCP